MDSLQDAFRALELFYDSPVLSDVTFVFDGPGESLHAHKLVLALRSSAFRDRFTSATALAGEAETEVRVADTEPGVFAALLRYCYTDELPEAAEGEGEGDQQLLRAAVAYQVPGLARVVADRLRASLTAGSAAGVLAGVDAVVEAAGARCPVGVVRLRQAAVAVLSTMAEPELLTALDLGPRVPAQALVDVLAQHAGADEDVRSASGAVLKLTVLAGREDAAALVLELADSAAVAAALETALRVGARDIARLLVRRAGDSLSSANTDSGDSLLHVAAETGELELCRVLLDADMGAEQPNVRSGRAPLHAAAAAGHADVAALLLERGAAPDAQDAAGDTPLHVARAVAVVDALRAAGADAALPNAQGRSALHAACARGDVEVVARLLFPDDEALAARRLDVAAPDNAGATPFHLAARALASGVLLLLLRAEAENRHDQAQQSVLLQTRSQSVAAPGSPGGAGHRARSNSADGAPAHVLTRRDNSGLTALHVAAQAQPEARVAKTLHVLLENGAEVDARTGAGQTALHLVASACDAGEPAKTLLDAGAEVDAPDAQGNTPLHLAVARGAADACVALVRGGAGVNIPNGDGRSALGMSLVRAPDSAFALTAPILQNLRKRVWVEDEQTPRCQACSNSFSVTNRRHHCRHCGRIVCHACSPSKIPIHKYGIDKKVRVCNLCFDVLCNGAVRTLAEGPILRPSA